MDEKSIEEQHKIYDSAPLQPSIRVETKKSVHAYYLTKDDVPGASWREIQERLIHFFGGDVKIKNPSRVMRLPYFAHLSAIADGTLQRQRVDLNHFDPSKRYTAEEMLKAFPARPVEKVNAVKMQTFGEDLSTWEGVNAELRRRMLNHSTCKSKGEWAHLKGVCHDGKGETGLALNLISNAYMCMKSIHVGEGCSSLEILNAFGLTPPQKKSAPVKPATYRKADEEIEETVDDIMRGADDDLEQLKARKDDDREGVYSVEDLFDQIDEIYKTGFTPGLSTGWGNLDELYTVKKKQWTLVTGMPNLGKSAVLDSLIINLATQHDWHFVIVSIENQPIARHVSRLMEIYTGAPMTSGFGIKKMSLHQRDKAKEWMNKHFTFICPDEADCTPKGLIKLLLKVGRMKKIDGVVIDPWNELEHNRPKHMSETEYISHSLSVFRRYARSSDTHLWLVAHPTKIQKDKDGKYPVPTLYDAAGSANFRNKSDNGLVIHRDLAQPHTPTQVHVQKVRFREVGRVGLAELYFDGNTGKFSETPTFSRNTEEVDEDADTPTRYTPEDFTSKSAIEVVRQEDPLENFFGGNF
jgi:hypothetical protein